MRFGDEIDWDAAAERMHLEDGGRGLHRSPELFEVIQRYVTRGWVLDCGCNIGRYAPRFIEAGYDYVGVDQSESAIRLARQRVPTAEFIHAFLWEMPVGRLYDVALSVAVLQHNLYHEKQEILTRIARVVRPDGIFVMQESTVPETTRTQLQHQEWIDLVQEHGFRCLETWHPNPEYNINDAYLFRRM